MRVAVHADVLSMRLWVTSLLGELGLRRALGARRRQIVGFMLFRAAGVGVGGVAIGLWSGPAVWNISPASWRTFRYGIQPSSADTLRSWEPPRSSVRFRRRGGQSERDPRC